MSTMREEFERWAKESGYCVQTLDRFNAYPPGTYSDSRTHAAWNAWQAATQASPALVPDEQAGKWQMVPKNATHEMVFAATKAETRHQVEDQRRGGNDPQLAFSAIYAAMLAAAPSRPVAEEKREPLTPERILELRGQCIVDGDDTSVGFCRLIEAEHGIGTHPSTGEDA